MILMVGGVGMFGGISGLAASFFLGGQDRKSAETKEILTRLDQLPAKLEAISLAARIGDSAKWQFLLCRRMVA